MLKYSFMSFSTPTLSLAEMLRVAADLGYAGIEPRADIRHNHGVELSADPAGRKAIRALADKSGVALACLATSCRFADPATADDNITQARAFIELAGDIGCGRLRVFGGDFGQSISRQRAADSIIMSLRALADTAARRQVVVCLETHDSWTNPAMVADIMGQVSHPCIAVNWDVMHTQRRGEATMEQAWRILRPWVRHMHVHDGRDVDGKLRIIPIGTGDYDHAAVLRLIVASEYDGFVSGEWMAGNMDPAFIADHLGPELATLKRLEQAARSDT